MRFGSRRNQRPPHQKHRSITTVSAMIDTIRIGHMTGPPLWNLSINQLPARKPVGCASAVGDAAVGGLIAAAAAGLVAAPGAGLSVTGIDAPGAAAGCCPCGTFVGGDCAGAAGFAGACPPGLIPGAAGGFCAGGGDCAMEVNANASEQTNAMNNVFIIVESEFVWPIALQGCLLSQNHDVRVQQNFSLFCPRGCTLYFAISLQGGCKASPWSCRCQFSVISSA